MTIDGLMVTGKDRLKTDLNVSGWSYLSSKHITLSTLSTQLFFSEGGSCRRGLNCESDSLSYVDHFIVSCFSMRVISNIYQ